MNHLTGYSCFEATAGNNRNTQGSTTKEYCVQNVSEVSFMQLFYNFWGYLSNCFSFLLLFFFLFQDVPKKGVRESSRQESKSVTTVSLSGGWVPGVSKGFHFWQPAPRLNNAPMAGTTLQPSHEPVTLKNQWKEREKNSNNKKREGMGGELNDNCSRPRWLKELHTLLYLRHTSETPHYCACASKPTSDRG